MKQLYNAVTMEHHTVLPGEKTNVSNGDDVMKRICSIALGSPRLAGVVWADSASD